MSNGQKESNTADKKTVIKKGLNEKMASCGKNKQEGHRLSLFGVIGMSNVGEIFDR